MPYVSRAGQKLEHAIRTFGINVRGCICADLGCSTGGFTDCLLQLGAAKVYSIDTGYGVLDWKLRNDPKVVVMERTNAMHVELPEPMDLITIDVAWTKQRHILPAARRIIRETGTVITLIKPHYESDSSFLRHGVLLEEKIPDVVSSVGIDMERAQFAQVGITTSPIKGAKGNIEMLAYLKPIH